MFKLSEAGSIIRKSYNQFENWRRYSNSRKLADRLRKKVIKRKGSSVADGKMIKLIKNYAASEFGDENYWHWLALYTEIRGEFLEGWIPDDYYAFELIPALNPENVSTLSLIKSFDHRLFPGHTIRPEAVRINGHFYNPQYEVISKTDLYNRLNEFNAEVVIKQDCGPSGTGLVFKHSRDVSESDFRDSFNYVIQPAVEQHDEMKKLSSSSVNTIRVLTIFEPGRGAECFFTSLKFGISDSRVDNVNMGGRFLMLDRDGVVTSNPYNELGLECRECMASGFVYKGFRVPSFRKAVEICKEQHLNYPYTRLIAWDVFIDAATAPKIIEWNARLPGMWVNEAVAGPLWSKRHKALVDQRKVIAVNGL